MIISGFIYPEAPLVRATLFIFHSKLITCSNVNLVSAYLYRSAFKYSSVLLVSVVSDIVDDFSRGFYFSLIIICK